MNKPRLAIGLALATVLLAIIALATGSASAQGFNDRFEEITHGFRFDFVNWEINILHEELGKIISGGPGISDSATSEVLEYFENVSRIRGLEAEIAAVTTGTRQGDLTTLENELTQLRQINTATADSVETVIRFEGAGGFGNLQARLEISGDGQLFPITVTGHVLQVIGGF